MRYINDRNLPDKAIDLIDEACSKKRIHEDPKPKAIRNKEIQIAELKLELICMLEMLILVQQQKLKRSWTN